MPTPQPLAYRVGFLGSPMDPDYDWSRANLQRMADLGFNTMQLHIAWGCRPGDEPLNIEDVVELPADLAARYPQPVPLQCDRSASARVQRRYKLRERLALCKEMGFRTIFHFGAPYNAHAKYGGTPPNCLQDEKVIARYEALLTEFARDFPGVDDILVYTYDQDAWLCSEFEDCPVCRGVPLHERLAPFIDRLTARWRGLSPAGLLWWSPWELSAGQVLRTLELVSPEGLGLDLHPNIAETQVTNPIDRWFRNTCGLAASRGIPVISESFLGAATEEIEPYRHLCHPHAIYRQIAAISNVPGVVGIKEYYGLSPDLQDDNLAMAGLCFKHPGESEEELVNRLADDRANADALKRFWLEASTAQELFPWETSWYLREVGKSDARHSLDAAIVRGQQCSTPAWDSTRSAIFLKTDDRPPQPWLCEDLQLRFEMAAERMTAALAVAPPPGPADPPEYAAGLAELADLRRKAMAYALHLRETNVADMMRADQAAGRPRSEALLAEMTGLLEADYANQQARQDALGLSLEGCTWIWDPEADHDQPWPFETRCFSTTFDLAGDVLRADLLCANTELVLRVQVNGTTIGRELPGITPFVVEDLKGLRAGPNTLSLVMPSGSRDATATRPGIAARLRIALADGSTTEVVTDPGWRVSTLTTSDPSPVARAVEAQDLWGVEPWMRWRMGDGGASVYDALQLLLRDPEQFLATTFTRAPGRLAGGVFSVTSA